MIHDYHGPPQAGVVAGVAGVGRGIMGGVFTGGIGSVVAVDAAPGNAFMRKECRYPCLRRVTGVTVQSGGYMRGVLSRGKHAIVAGCTAADDLGVINVGRGPGGGQMAVCADRCTADVIGAFPCCIGSVVAGKAFFSGFLVGEKMWSPGTGTVTVTAFQRRWNMVGGFAGGRGAVVTGVAGADDFVMIDACHGFPAGRGVACCTITG